MNDTMSKIAAGLEQAFSAHGFAESNVETLRAAAGVSLRTLYKYAASRDEMVHMALEHRHRRYIALLFTDLPEPGAAALSMILDRVAQWMTTEAAHGCLFHSAVAAAPQNTSLRELLGNHKAEVARRATNAAGLPRRCEGEIMLILDGLTQTWPLLGPQALASAKRLSQLLLGSEAGGGV